MTDLDLDTDVVTLTAALCDIESVSGDEEGLADAIEAALRGLGHLEVIRDGDTVVARTQLGRAERVVLAGHLDTVPLTEPPNLPTWREGERAARPRHVDMKGGVAVQLRLAATVHRAVPRHHLRLLRLRGGRGRAQRARADRAPPARAARRRLRRPARADQRHRRGRLQRHAAGRGHRPRGGRALRAGLDGPQRDPRGGNGAGPADGVRRPRPSRSTGWTTARRSTRSVSAAASPATSSPTRCVVTVNYRFAPSKTGQEAITHVRELFDGYDVEVTRLGRRRAARPAPARGQGVRRGDRGAGLGQVRLDRRRPLLRPVGARRSTSARVTPTWPTTTRSACPSSSWSTPRRRCCGGSPDVRPLVA